MPDNEVQRFIQVWDYEAKNTAKLFRALPSTQYDFRPVKNWRSRELCPEAAGADAMTSNPRIATLATVPLEMAFRMPYIGALLGC